MGSTVTRHIGCQVPNRNHHNQFTLKISLQTGAAGCEGKAVKNRGTAANDVGLEPCEWTKIQVKAFKEEKAEICWFRVIKERPRIALRHSENTRFKSEWSTHDASKGKN